MCFNMNAAQTLLLFISFFILSQSKADMNIDLDDILSSKYMPNVFLFDKTNYNISNITTSRRPEGSIDDALDTMVFHRTMMNQFMCRSYVADKILSTIKHQAIHKRRSDDSDDSLAEKRNRKELLYDEGSSAYNNWLSRNYIYQNIYKNDDYSNNPDQPLETNSEERTNRIKGEFYNVDIASNALNNRHVNHGNIPIDSTGTQIVDQEPVVIHYTNNLVHNKNIGKSEQLAEIFEVALTAVAFLSFGIFVIHLVMSISAMSSQSTTTPNIFMAMSRNPTATAPDLGEDSNDNIGSSSINANSETENDYSEINTEFDDNSDSEGQDDRFNFRLKRGAPTISNPSTEALNEMSKHILSSIDATLIVYADNGTCLERSICISNKYSTELSGLNKFILPIWNLGLIWVQRSVLHKGSMIKGLQAAVLGLGKASCKTLYQNCEMQKYKYK